MYEYLVGVLIVGVIWVIGFFLRKDLRRPIIWSGLVYAGINAVAFILWKIGSFFIYLGEPVVPSYWNPNTLFNLIRVTGGFSIEDIVWMFFVAGIATFVYGLFLKKKIKFKKNYKHHVRALIVGMIVAFLFQLITKANLIYAMIIFGFVGAFFIWIERRDLIEHSLVGGLSFLVVYFSAFSLFNVIFPYFLNEFYVLQGITGMWFLGLPFEEHLYALSFGLLWAPIYEYEHGEKDVDLK